MGEKFEIEILDTTLRDGAQGAQISTRMRADERSSIAWRTEEAIEASNARRLRLSGAPGKERNL